MGLQRVCAYCGKEYSTSAERHKITRCPEYPLNPRGSCGYCGAVLQRFSGAYAEHLLAECERVPAKVRSQLRIDYRSVRRMLYDMRKAGPRPPRSVRTVRGGGKRTKPQ